VHNTVLVTIAEKNTSEYANLIHVNDTEEERWMLAAKKMFKNVTK
jgi:hypothetical protein